MEEKYDDLELGKDDLGNLYDKYISPFGFFNQMSPSRMAQAMDGYSMMADYVGGLLKSGVFRVTQIFRGKRSSGERKDEISDCFDDGDCKGDYVREHRLH
jgi:hypothetical protein